jgi:YegS/Rv2252/BmrU family lipid kinase
VNEVVNGLAGTNVPLGIVPLGTANDFAQQARIPMNPEAALGVVLRHAAARIDLASLNGRKFVNVSTAGIGALVTAEANPAAKAALGPLAYAVSGVMSLARMRPYQARFTAPGFKFEGSFLVFAIGNARRTGGGTNITPEASVTDGLFDVCIIESMSRMEFASLVLQLRHGVHLQHPGVHYAKLHRLSIEPSRAVPVNVDGEFGQYKHLEYRSHRLDLLAILPRVPDLWKR